ncbi:MAG: Gfo/Idh/MocA family oxidoreductase [Ignavibacteriales bacterium]|nr:Gfo/Idh/MocA family oxidoreductase [Ignavibacteriota bacterium]MCB9250317.1 Gfo/Idh/MocA family oxidoreductase [Ignavibacteriales bacterium]
MTDLKKKIFDRREFIKLSAAAGTGILLSPYIKTSGQESSVTNDINIALLGTGAQGQVLLSAILKIPNIKFKAVCDIWTDYNQLRAHRLLQKYGHELNAYVDYKEMLAKEKDLDAVIVATPDFWHAQHAVDCMEAGLHVYCEKEMSNTLEGARRIVRAAKRTGRLVQIGHQRRSNPYYLHSYNNIINNSDILGRITTVNGQWNRSVQPDNGWPKGKEIPLRILQRYGFENMNQFRNWRWYKNLGGGPIVDLGSHQIDIYNWFLNSSPKSVMASGGTDYYDKATHEWYDTVLATYKYDTPQGTVRAFYQTITTNSNQGYFESFMGDQGSLVISESAGRAGIYKEPNAPSWDKWIEKGVLESPSEPAPTKTTALLDVRETVAPPKHSLPITFNDPYHQPHLENFFNAIRGKEKLNCPVEVGYESAVTVLKVNEAVKAQREIAFNPSDFAI